MLPPEELLDMAINALEGGADDTGFCTTCGEEHYGVEPDARRYTCESCGKSTVYGAEEILIQFG